MFWGALSDKVNAKYILVFNNVIGSLLIPTLYIARSHKVSQAKIVKRCSFLGVGRHLPFSFSPYMRHAMAFR